MKKLLFFLILFMARFSHNFKRELIILLKKIKNMLKTETVESKKIIEIYFNYSKGRATKEDVKWANKQLRDVIKALGIGTILILPFAPLTLPFLVKLGRKLDIDILPDSFHDD